MSTRQQKPIGSRNETTKPRIYARNRILQGNCVQRMAHLPSESIDLIVTDPPYLVNYRDRNGRTIANDTNGDWLKPAFEEMYRLLKPDSYCVVFYGWNSIDQFMSAWKSSGFKPVAHLVWQKSYASSTNFIQARHECAYLLVKGNPKRPDHPLPSVLPWKYSGNKYHPTQKPVSVLQPLIECFSKSNDLILDPFAGSGSTAVASRLANRAYIGFELDKNYHAAAVKRLKHLFKELESKGG